MPKLIDLTGKTFGYVFVENRAPDTYTSGGHLRVMWNCLCLRCNKRFVTDGQALRKGLTLSCGCYGRDRRIEAAHNSRVDLTGKTFGWLFVESPAGDYIKPNGAHVTRWNCLCLRCGNKTIAFGEMMKANRHISCGCYKDEQLGKRTFVDLSGKTFSKLYVESRAENHYLPDNTPIVMYNCICECGNKVIVSGNNLRSGNTKSCGCLGSSYGESLIKEILKKNNISFKYDSGFNDLKTSKGGYPRFDFKIFNNNNKLLCVIEIQGLQHYKPRKNSDFGKFQREETDKLKREYCFAHNIPLYEIKYDEDYEKRIYEILHQINVLHANPVPSSE